MLAGTDQTEILAGDFFDEARIFLEPPHLLAKDVVLALQGGDPLGKAGLLPTGCPRGQQPALADQGIRHERAGSEHQHDLNCAPGDPTPGDRSQRRR